VTEDDRDLSRAALPGGAPPISCLRPSLRSLSSASASRHATGMLSAVSVLGRTPSKICGNLGRPM